MNYIFDAIISRATSYAIDRIIDTYNDYQEYNEHLNKQDKNIIEEYNNLPRVISMDTTYDDYEDGWIIANYS